ncbi:MAG: DUF1440 domain-containing protein [Chitinophagaceae bacterium]|nr:DUF1440 domain-containing protein [Chitinophagaceae bacterium]
MVTSKSFIKTILLTGLIAGTLDAAAASIKYLIDTNGGNPLKVWRYVAGVAFGPETKTKDLYAMAAWGLWFHYIIAMSFTLFFFLCYRPIRTVLTNKFAAGIGYGIFVWCVMSLLVLPIANGENIGARLEKLVTMYKESLIAIGILIIAIGLPISLLADRYYSKKVPY